MRYYPIQLDIQGRSCLVVGGGAVATRKVKTLLACGARVTVVSPEASADLQALSRQGALTLIGRPYRSADLDGMFLVIGATDQAETNRRIYQDAEAGGKLCNIADQPDLCNFILPAIVQRGDLMLTVSTSGKSPAFAKRLRQKLETEFGPEYAQFLQLMGAVREKLLQLSHQPEAHKASFESLIDRGLLGYLRQGETSRIDSLLYEVLGEGFRYDALMGRREKLGDGSATKTQGHKEGR